MADSTPESFGKVLADARAARRMTLQQVSAATKIPVSKLQALERDEIENLPGGIFTRGFVRSYAEVVGLDPQKMLVRFEARFPEESFVANPHATVEGRTNEKFARRTAKGLIWFALLSLPLVVWLWAVFMPEDRQPAEPDEAVAGRVEPSSPSRAALPSPPAAVPAEPRDPPAPAPAESRDPPAAASTIPSPRPRDPPATAPVDSGRLTLEISPTADCWVQASADGDPVISRVLNAGEREVIVARGAIDLRIGDAGAFAFTINQRPGRLLGAPGQVVNVRVTPSNYLSFIAE